MSVLTRIFENLGRDQSDLEAEELSAECRKVDCQRIANVAVRSRARLTGCVHSVAVPPREAEPQISVELYDGTGMLQVIWLGRRSIGGIVPGAFITVEGRVSEVDGRPTMFNPSYHLIPKRS